MVLNDTASSPISSLRSVSRIRTSKSPSAYRRVAATISRMGRT